MSAKPLSLWYTMFQTSVFAQARNVDNVEPVSTTNSSYRIRWELSHRKKKKKSEVLITSSPKVLGLLVKLKRAKMESIPFIPIQT